MLAKQVLEPISEIKGEDEEVYATRRFRLGGELPSQNVGMEVMVNRSAVQSDSGVQFTVMGSAQLSRPKAR